MFPIGLTSQDSILLCPWPHQTVYTNTAFLSTSPFRKFFLYLLQRIYSFVKWTLSYHVNRKRRNYIIYFAVHGPFIQSEASRVVFKGGPQFSEPLGLERCTGGKALPTDGPSLWHHPRAQRAEAWGVGCALRMVWERTADPCLLTAVRDDGACMFPVY